MLKLLIDVDDQCLTLTLLTGQEGGHVIFLLLFFSFIYEMRQLVFHFCINGNFQANDTHLYSL
jgi:hypothetical protein